MKLHIIAVGSMDNRDLGRALDEYVNRVSRYTQTVVEEVDPGNADSEFDRKREEAEALEAVVPDDAVCVAVDQRGKKVTSESFADWVQKQMVGGRRHVAFCIGGAYGLDAQFRQNVCDWSLSLSGFTLPHELARVVLAEQLYRAMTIVRGEPYHK